MHLFVTQQCQPGCVHERQYTAMYTATCITQYGSTVYIGMAMGGSAL